MLTTKYIIDPVALNILEFWFDKKTEKKWFIKDGNFDNEISLKFENIYKKARSGFYDGWADLPEEILALIIIFDQFPRNMYRSKPKAFASDEEALELTKHAIKYKMDYKLMSKSHRQFLYMPLMHSEDKGDQKISLEKFATLGKEAYDFALLHKNIIDKFGRFPHRNEILRRRSTIGELDFLKEMHSGF